MALVLKDRVKVLATTTGTGTFTLGAAVTGFQDFSVIGNGNTTYYTIAAQATPDWEVGIGTYTASGTLLSRDTILESSNSGAAVDFPAGTKDVFVTYPAERATYLDTAGAYPVQNTFNTLNAANAVLTAGTVSTTPVNATDLVNKTYVDTAVSSGIHFHQPVRVESPINLNATYNNGTAGVGATLTNAGTQVALVIDGVTVSVADRVLVYEQTTQTQNGIYVVTDVGSGSTNWILTRSSDADTYAVASANGLGEGSAVFVQQGTTGAGETYVCNTAGTITFGTTNITFAQISSAQIYSAGTGLTLSGTQFSLSNTGTAGTYGSASNVPVFTTNAQGQVTAVTDTAIAIAAGAVSGLAASATTDTTNASNITSGTLGTSRLSGSYTGITGVGTLAAGTWNGSTIDAVYGGTGLSSFVAGDIIYADSSTTLARLADVAVGNALISGGASADPSWGKIGLTTHVDGILPVANGGTGNATNQAASVANNATFNDGGAGAASGSTFNGSSPLTISYNTLGAYPTTNPAGYTSNTGTVTSVGGTGTVNGLTLTGTVTTSGNLTLGGTLSGIANAALTNSSVTVNGTSIALGASGTITANNPNALTINNGGAGGASGTTYNGSSAITISYNTVGAPSTTGTNASGTWGISITGSAGSLSNTTNFLIGRGNFAAANINTTTGLGVWNQLNAGDSDTVLVFGQGGSTSTVQMVFKYTGSIQFRNFTDSANWTTFKTILTSINFSGYALPITGGSLITTASNNLFIGRNSTATAYNSISLNGNPADSANMGMTGGGGSDTTLYINAPGQITFRTNSFAQTSTLTAAGFQNDQSLRSPIFYDSQNTGYFVNPNSNSTIRGLVNVAAGHGDTNIRLTAIGGELGSGATSTMQWWVSEPGVSWNDGGFGYNVANDNGSPAGFGRLNTGFGQAYTRYTTSGAMVFYCTNTGGTRYQMMTLDPGNFITVDAASIRSPIYYDRDDTAYYCDPAGINRFNRLTLPSNAGSGVFPMSVNAADRGIIFDNTLGSGIPCYFTVNSGGTVSGSIIASGGSTSYNTSSDYRMKENDLAIDTDAALAKIMSLRPVTFDWKQEFGGRKGIGFIAHELDVVAPECVNGEKDAVNEDGSINPQSVDTSWLIPSICAAMQKQQKAIEQLTAELAVLKGT